MSIMCPVVTPNIQELANKIRQSYPEACERDGFNDQKCAEWVGIYNSTNNQSIDNVPSMESLVNHIEKLRNKEGKSFKRDLEAEESKRAIEQEMQEIKTKAIADGTFMKAPNGKDTNLTEKQWLQVRTKAFKDWFGDWEKLAPKSDATERLLEKLNNIVNSKSKFAALAKVILENHALPYNLKYFKVDNNREDVNGHAAMWHSLVNLIEVLGNSVSEEEINKALLHELIHYNTESFLNTYRVSPENVPQSIRQNIKELYSIIDYAKKYITEHFDEKKFREIADRQNSNIGSRVFYAFDNQGNVEIDEFISEIFTNPGLQEILNEIPYKETKQTLWDKLKEAIQSIFNIDIKHGSVLEEALKASTEFITKAKNEYDSVSKVVDENGEPLVVYHHTNNPNLTEFSTDFENYFAKDGGTKEAIFFDEEKTGTLNRKYDIPVFLNIRELNEYNETKQQLHDRGTTYREIVNNSAKKNNKTGGVHMKDFDDNKKEHQSIWIIHNSNQVKSATDNNGEFSTENDSILATPQAYEEIPVELMGSIANETTALEAFDDRESSDPDLYKKFGGKTEVTVSEILNNLLLYNSPFEDFIKALQENIGELGSIQVKIVPNSNSKVYGIAGLYSALDNTIYINRNSQFRGKDGKVDNSILHEIVHAIVTNSLNTLKHREELGKIFEEAREKIFKKYEVNSFDQLPEYLRTGRLYGLQSLDEFAAEFFTNSEFILELNDENTFGKRSNKTSIISKLLEWIKSLLPKGVTETYKRSGEILEDIILNSGGTIQTLEERKLLGKDVVAANIQNYKLSTPGSPLQVYSDGSDFKGTGKIGYGSVFELSGRQYGISGTEENEEVKKLQQQFPEAKFSNPTMEMLALTTTLEYFANRGNGENIVINQDYKGACNYQGLWEYSEGSAQRDPKAWKAKEPYIKHLVDRSVAAIEKINKDGGSVKINWVKGHQTAGTEQARMNDAADRYAKSRDNSNTMDDAYPKQPSQQSTQKPSTIDPRFKQGVETLAGYYEGGGASIADDFPGLPKRLDDKLNNHFMGGEELTDADYYELDRYVRIVSNPNPENGAGAYIATPKKQINRRIVQQTSTFKAQENQPSPQDETGSFGFTQEELQEAAAQAQQKNLPETEPQIPRPLSPSYETALKAPTSEQNDFYRAFSPEQIVDRARMIKSMFSDIVDDTIYERREFYQSIIDDSQASDKDKENAKRSLETYRDPVLARVAAVNFRTYSGIMKEIEEDLSTQEEFATDPVTKQKLQNTIKYFELLTNEAAKWIDEEDGVRKGNNKSSEEEEQDNEDFGDNDEGNASNGNDGWSFKERFNNPFKALSKMVKRVLSGIETGQKDDLGNGKTYSQGFIYSALMSYLSKNLESADDFMQLTREDDYREGQKDVEGLPITKELYPHGYPTFPALEKMRAKYAWADQVIARLTKDWRAKDEEDGTQLKYPPTYGQLASQFYTNFRKAFIPYAKIQVGLDKNGNSYFGTTPLNFDMEDRSQRDELERSYNNGITYSPDSLYNTDKTLNIENAKKVGKSLDKLLGGDKISYLYTAFHDNMVYEYPIDDEYKNQAKEVLNIVRAFGINVDKDNIKSLIVQDENGESLKSLLSDLRGIARQVESLTADKNYFLDIKNKYGRSVWENFFEGRGFVTETNLMQSFYDPASKKTLYSYSADNYLQKTMRYLFSKNISKERRQQYLDEHFGEYEWFRDQSAPKGKGWKSLWLENAYNAENLSEIFPYRNINSVDIIGKDGSHEVHPYNNWDESDIYRVMLRSWDNNSGDFGYYLSPIFADSPMSMTVRGPKYSRNELIEGTFDKSGKYVPSGFVRLLDQELQRIKYIRETRAKAIKEGKVLPITNYEKNGSKFCFMPELNEKMFGPNEDMSFYDYIVQLTKDYDVSQDKIAGAYSEIIRNAEIDAIQKVLQRKYWEFIEGMPQDVREEYAKDAERDEQGNITTAGIYDIFEIPYYNMVYASTQIVELTTVDTAFYKNSTDFQKRFKEVYASGTRMNTNSRFGKKFDRVLLVADEQVTSRSYNFIKKVVDNSEGRMTKKERDYVLSCFAFLKGKQDGINVSDAQALRSLTSYRSFLDMIGKWDERTEAAYHRIVNGEWNVADFDLVLQTLKPFVYSVIAKNDGVGGKIAVPVQHKNSELVLLAMYDLICGGLKNSAKLRGINRFLEEVKDADGNPIADMLQFESAGKAGNQGIININYSHKKVIDTVNSGEIRIVNDKGIITDTVFLSDKGFKENTRSNTSDNFDEIKTQLTRQLQSGKISQETFNKCVDYFQPTEEEVIETLTTYATIKNEADDSLSINPEAVQEVPNEDYMIAQPTPEHHMDAQAPQGSQGRNIIVADLPETFKLALAGRGKDIRTMSKEELINFYYDLITENLIQNFMELREVFKDKESLRDKVMQLASDNPTYGRDFAEAINIDKSTGNFVLSPNSPTIFKKVQQLVNSVIKNSIAVQKVNGAALIQASGIGLSEELNLVFDKNGKPVGAECYLPATARRFFEVFMKKEKINEQWVDVLDIEALQRAKLDKAIGYRIPTENKSSMLPIIIKGFAPQQNGSCIFLPAEITTLSGSDFDVDKMFLMLSDFYVQEFRMREARWDFAKSNSLFNDILKGLLKAGNISEADLDDENIKELQTEAFGKWFEKNKERYRLDKPVIRIAEYDFSKTPKQNGRRARNTMLVQIMYKILTSQEGAENMFNPQHFEGVKESSKMMRIMQDRNLLDKYMEENNLDEDTVIDYLLNDSEENLISFVKDNDVERSPIYPQTFNYFHQQNMAGDALLAMFALQVSAAAKFQRANITIKKKNQFTINGRLIKDVDKVFNGLGEHRLKNVSQFVGACADNGKDPNVTDFGATRRNAKMVAYLLRAGLSIKETALIINQPTMQLLPSQIKNLAGKREEWKDSNISSATLARAIMQPDKISDADKKAIAIMCLKIIEQSNALADLTSMSRADSPNGGIPETFAKARLYKYKVDLFNGNQYSYDFPFEPIEEAISNTKVDVKASEDVIRQQIQAQRMSMLQGFYSLGVQSFDTLLSPFFFMLEESFDNAVTKRILNQLPKNMSDDTKESILDALYKDFITYSLSGFALFGDEKDEANMKSKREYYLDEFPKKFNRILAEYPEIRNAIGNVLSNDRGRIVLKNGGQLIKGQREEIMRRITGLRYMQNPETQKVADELAKDLFIYSFFDNGLQFTKDSFSTMFSTQFCTSFEGYNEFLQELGNNLSVDNINRFIEQFFNNHPEMALVVRESDIKNSDVIANGSITIDRHKNHAFDNPIYSGVRPYNFISHNDTLYIVSHWDADFIKYVPLTRFGNSKILYNLNKTNEEMADDYNYVPTPKEDSPMTLNDWMAEMAYQAEAFYDHNNATDSQVPMNNPETETPTTDSSSSQDNEQSNSDNYMAGGLAQMKDKPCKK